MIGPDTDCRHRDCDGVLRALPDDPLLPHHLTRLECDRCGEWWLFDGQDGTAEIDA